MSLAAHMETLLVGFGISVVEDGHSSSSDCTSTAPRQGLHATAARRFLRGDLVLRALPAALSFDFRHLSTWCASCHRHGQATLPHRCDTCEKVYYCSTECEQSHQCIHAPQCPILSKLETLKLKKEASQIARCACDLISRVHTTGEEAPIRSNDADAICKGDDWQRCTSPHAATMTSPFDAYPDMEHVLHLMQEGDLDERGRLSKACKQRRDAVSHVLRIWSSLQHSSPHVPTWTSVPSKNTLRHALATFALNSFGFYNKGDVCGRAIYPAAAMFNHSCRPNVAYRHEGSALCFYALEDIREREALYISYIDMSLSTDQRRVVLQKQWNFHCDCPRCTAHVSLSPIIVRSSVHCWHQPSMR
eukprot:m.592950 g.592950  ORF g.592950 m.592950 type:complete len:361 (-) comp22391_c0_seq42:341-1423(-)